MMVALNAYVPGSNTPTLYVLKKPKKQTTVDIKVVLLKII